MPRFNLGDQVHLPGWMVGSELTGIVVGITQERNVQAVQATLTSGTFQYGGPIETNYEVKFADPKNCTIWTQKLPEYMLQSADILFE